MLPVSPGGRQEEAEVGRSAAAPLHRGSAASSARLLFIFQEYKNIFQNITGKKTLKL